MATASKYNQTQFRNNLYYSKLPLVALIGINYLLSQTASKAAPGKQLERFFGSYNRIRLASLQRFSTTSEPLMDSSC